jgi:hypothetical protein
VFASQTQNPGQRRLARIGAIRKRLDAPLGLPLDKPPYMHWATYERLRGELRALEEEAALEAFSKASSLRSGSQKASARDLLGSAGSSAELEDFGELLQTPRVSAAVQGEEFNGFREALGRALLRKIDQA